MGISQETEKDSEVTPEIIDNLNECIRNHPQVVKSTISNDTLSVPNPEQPGKKITGSKLIIQISIRGIHNDLISESIIYQLKEAIYETTVKPLISDTALHTLMHKNVRKIKDRQKKTCGCKILTAASRNTERTSKS